MNEVRLYDIERLRIARGPLGQGLTWAPYPWFSDVQALVGLDDGGVLIGGAAGVTQLTADLRCTWRDDGEAIVDLDLCSQGLIGAGQHLSLWSAIGAEARRFAPESIGLYAAPVRVRWNPDQRRAAVADELGQVVIVTVLNGEVTLEQTVGDVPQVDGLAWDPAGLTLAIASVHNQDAAVWTWTARDGLRMIPLVHGDPDLATKCVVTFNPVSGALYVFHGCRVSTLREGVMSVCADLVDEENEYPLPTNARFLGFTAGGRLVASASAGIYIWDLTQGTHSSYEPRISIRVNCNDPCCCFAGERLWIGTAEGLLAYCNRDYPWAGHCGWKDPSERYCWGVPRLGHSLGDRSLAHDGSALALATGYDRVSVWSLERTVNPVKVRTWEDGGVGHRWHRHEPWLQIYSRGEPILDHWARLDVGEGDREDEQWSPPCSFLSVASAPLSECVNLTAFSIELPGRAGDARSVSLPRLGLERVIGVAWTPGGDLVIVGSTAS